MKTHLVAASLLIALAAAQGTMGGVEHTARAARQNALYWAGQKTTVDTIYLDPVLESCSLTQTAVVNAATWDADNLAFGGWIPVIFNKKDTPAAYVNYGLSQNFTGTVRAQPLTGILVRLARPNGRVLTYLDCTGRQISAPELLNEIIPLLETLPEADDAFTPPPATTVVVEKPVPTTVIVESPAPVFVAGTWGYRPWLDPWWNCGIGFNWGWGSIIIGGGYCPPCPRPCPPRPCPPPVPHWRPRPPCLAPYRVNPPLAHRPAPRPMPPAPQARPIHELRPRQITAHTRIAAHPAQPARPWRAIAPTPAKRPAASAPLPRPALAKAPPPTARGFGQPAYAPNRPKPAGVVPAARPRLAQTSTVPAARTQAPFAKRPPQLSAAPTRAATPTVLAQNRTVFRQKAAASPARNPLRTYTPNNAAPNAFRQRAQNSSAQMQRPYRTPEARTPRTFASSAPRAAYTPREAPRATYNERATYTARSTYTAPASTPPRSGDRNAAFASPRGTPRTASVVSGGGERSGGRRGR